MKDWIKTLISGIAMGVGSAIPGVSGGTIAVIFKVYEKIIWAVSNIFKEFLKALAILIPLGIGLLIGVIPTLILMHKALEGFVFGTVCIFAGFIAGSFPQITDEVKGKPFKKSYIVVLIIAMLAAIALAVGSCFSTLDVMARFNNPEVWFYFLLIPIGIVSSFALAVPGISGGMILILLGYYRPLIDSTVNVAKECLSGDWSRFGTQIGLLMCFAVGVICGFVLASKIMNYLLNKYHDITYYGIIGFCFGSLLSLFMNHEIYNYYLNWASGNQGALSIQIEIPLGIGLMVIAGILSFLLVRYLKNREHKEGAVKKLES